MGNQQSTKEVLKQVPSSSAKLSDLPGAASVLSSEQEQGQQPNAVDNSAIQDQADGRKYISLAEALTDFDITPLGNHSSLRLRQIFENAPISSSLEPNPLRWQGETEGHLFTGTRDLFQEIYQEESTLQNEIQDNEEFFGADRSTGFLCWWEYTEPKPDEDLYYDSDDESIPETFSRDLNYVWMEDELAVTLGPKALAKEGSELPTGEPTAKVVEIRRLQRNRAHHGDGPEFGHFVVNADQPSLSINGIQIGMGVVCGPLPDFAIIELDGNLLIWWGTPDAVNFESVQETDGRLKRPLAEFQEYENLSENMPRAKRSKVDRWSSLAVQQKPVEPPIPVSDWCLEFQKKLGSCNWKSSRRLDIGSTSELPHQLTNYTGLAIEDVVLAIAAIGATLGIQGIEYNFGDADLYLNARHGRRRGAACVGTSETFIMPLIFDQSSQDLTAEDPTNIEPAPPVSFSQFQDHGIEQTKVQTGDLDAKMEQTGQDVRDIILAIARFNQDTESVEISYYENKGGEISQGLARRTARNLVRNSGWLRDSWPKFGDERWLLPARQLGDTSGFHTILNAWSYMLDLKVKMEPDFELTSDFYAEGLQIINLGLLGTLNDMAIRALLHCHGYLCPQDWLAVMKEGGENAVRKGPLYENSFLMNRNILGGVITQMHAQEDAQMGPVKGTLPRIQRAAPQEVESWQVKLSGGFRRYQAEMTTSKTFRKLVDMSDENVFIAIACVWESLRAMGTEFAFGTGDTFRFNRSSGMISQGLTVVLGPNRLIMPLLFNQEMPDEEEQKVPKGPKGKGKRSRRKASSEFSFDPLGHHMLAVATRESLQDHRVRISTIDSSPGFIDQMRITAAAEGLVRYTGWMGIDGEGLPVAVSPSFDIENTLTPKQEGRNTCGFYVILNAWATMLGIPITPEDQRRPNTTSEREFLRNGLKLINLAVAGCLDSATIQAFMNHHGYSVAQDPGEPSIAVVDVRTTAMDEKKFGDLMDQLRILEKIETEKVPRAQGLNSAQEMPAPATPAVVSTVLPPEDVQLPALTSTVLPPEDVQLPAVASTVLPPEDVQLPADESRFLRPEHVKILKEAGYPYESVRAALLAANGRIELAFEYLINHHQLFGF